MSYVHVFKLQTDCCVFLLTSARVLTGNLEKDQVEEVGKKTAKDVNREQNLLPSPAAPFLITAQGANTKLKHTNNRDW